MRRSNFALRVQKSLLEEARKLAEAEGVALNQFINVALAEKLAAMRTAAYFPGTRKPRQCSQGAQDSRARRQEESTYARRRAALAPCPSGN